MHAFYDKQKSKNNHSPRSPAQPVGERQNGSSWNGMALKREVVALAARGEVEGAGGRSWLKQVYQAEEGETDASLGGNKYIQKLNFSNDSSILNNKLSSHNA